MKVRFALTGSTVARGVVLSLHRRESRPAVLKDRAQSIAREAIAREGSARAAYIDEACAGDCVLRAAVESLLAAQSSQTIAADHDAGVFAGGGRAAAPVSNGAAHGGSPANDASSMGGYRILSVLGEGGMGLVYLAEQRSTGQRVALKVVRPGLVSPKTLRRFEHEVRILARLQHEGIARIYEAGTMEPAPGSGSQPFFAMEFVEGRTLTAHAQGAELSLNDRLAVVAEVARIVHHAHTRGVVHRDLKPANILVTPDGRLKVLDFGVARVLEDDSDSAHTMQTQAGQVLGTLPYMSPEQVLGETERIDTRSDVYTLGVILYELLTGRLPHDVTGKSIIEAARAITEETARPLTALSQAVPRDVRTMVGKAMSREPERRYQSAEELASDIGRFLRFEPISARPASAWYVASRFARRHSAATVAVGGIALALVLGAVGTAGYAVLATQQRDRAVEAERTAVAVNNLLVDMLAAADPERSLGRELTVRDLLDQAAPVIESDPSVASRPLVRAPLHIAIGRAYQGLAALDRAEAHFVAAEALYSEAEGPGSLNAIKSRRHLATVVVEKGDAAAAEAITRAAYEELERRLGPDHAETVSALTELARCVYQTGDLERGLSMLAEAAERTARALGPDSGEALTALHNYATALKDAGRSMESIGVLRDVLERRSRVWGERHPQTLFTKNNLATALVVMGRSEEAEALLRETWEARREILGADHINTATTALNLVNIMIPSGRLEEAEPVLRGVLVVYRDRLGPDHARTTAAENALAYLLEELGNLDGAEAMYRSALATVERLKGIYQPDTLAPMNNLAMLLTKKGSLEEADALFVQLIERAVAIAGPAHPFVAVFQSNRALCLTAMGRSAEAVELLEAAVVHLGSTLGEDHARTVTARERLAAAREAAGARGAE